MCVANSKRSTEKYGNKLMLLTEQKLFVRVAPPAVAPCLCQPIGTCLTLVVLRSSCCSPLC